MNPELRRLALQIHQAERQRRPGAVGFEDAVLMANEQLKTGRPAAPRPAPRNYSELRSSVAPPRSDSTADQIRAAQLFAERHTNDVRRSQHIGDALLEEARDIETPEEYRRFAERCRKAFHEGHP